MTKGNEEKKKVERVDDEEDKRPLKIKDYLEMRVLNCTLLCFRINLSKRKVWHAYMEIVVFIDHCLNESAVSKWKRYGKTEIIISLYFTFSPFIELHSRVEMSFIGHNAGINFPKSN